MSAAPIKIPRFRASELKDDFFEPAELPETSEKVREILSAVRTEGDAAVERYAAAFDGWDGRPLRVGEAEIAAARAALEEESPELAQSLRTAATNLRGFANRQLSQYQDFEAEISSGVYLGQRVVPIANVGLYVPGGRYPLFSSLLMSAVPALAAGCGRVFLCSPPRKDPGTGKALGIDRAVLACCDILGVREVYEAGGAQAIAAMAYGTATIRRADMIAGPGNRYVTMAKREVSGFCGIDFLAGPSEVLIVADDSSDPCWVAADMVAQAEHDADAQAILVSLDGTLFDKVEAEVERQLASLPTAAVARESLARNAAFVLAASEDEAAAVADRKAAEHLELAMRYPESISKKLSNFGSLFIGHHAAEVFGDYASGINHILPTHGTSRFTAGLSVRNFLKLPTTLRAKQGTGLERIAKASIAMAEAEGLAGHAAAARARTGADC